MRRPLAVGSCGTRRRGASAFKGRGLPPTGQLNRHATHPPALINIFLRARAFAVLVPAAFDGDAYQMTGELVVLGVPPSQLNTDRRRDEPRELFGADANITQLLLAGPEARGQPGRR